MIILHLLKIYSKWSVVYRLMAHLCAGEKPSKFIEILLDFIQKMVDKKIVIRNNLLKFCIFEKTMFFRSFPLHFWCLGVFVAHLLLKERNELIINESYFLYRKVIIKTNYKHIRKNCKMIFLSKIHFLYLPIIKNNFKLP